MSVHATPSALQRSHWYVNVGTGNPSHDPVAAVSVEPVWVVPEIDGGVRFDGAPGTPTGADVAEPEPAPFVAVTTTRIV